MTRDEAIQRLKNTAWLGSDKDREETEEAIDKAIEALSEPKTGKWIQTDDDEGGITGVCSVCGWESILYETDIVDEANFCPNCGCAMDKGEE